MELKIIRAHTFMLGEIEDNLRVQFRDWADGTFGDLGKGRKINIHHSFVDVEETVNGNGSKYKIYRLFVFYERLPISPTASK